MKLLRRYRMSVGLTQTALASMLGVKPSTISFWESGASLPSPKYIPQLAGILRLDAMALTRVIKPDPEAATATATA